MVSADRSRRPRKSIARRRNSRSAWVLAQGDDIVPIPGTKRRKYLDEISRRWMFRCTPDDLARIDEIAPQGAAGGPALSRST